MSSNESQVKLPPLNLARVQTLATSSGNNEKSGIPQAPKGSTVPSYMKAPQLKARKKLDRAQVYADQVTVEEKQKDEETQRLSASSASLISQGSPVIGRGKKTKVAFVQRVRASSQAEEEKVAKTVSDNQSREKKGEQQPAEKFFMVSNKRPRSARQRRVSFHNEMPGTKPPQVPATMEELTNKLNGLLQDPDPVSTDDNGQPKGTPRNKRF